MTIEPPGGRMIRSRAPVREVDARIAFAGSAGTSSRACSTVSTCSGWRSSRGRALASRSRSASAASSRGSRASFSNGPAPGSTAMDAALKERCEGWASSTPPTSPRSRLLCSKSVKVSVPGPPGHTRPCPAPVQGESCPIAVEGVWPPASVEDVGAPPPPSCRALDRRQGVVAGHAGQCRRERSRRGRGPGPPMIGAIETLEIQLSRTVRHRSRAAVRPQPSEATSRKRDCGRRRGASRPESMPSVFRRVQVMAPFSPLSPSGDSPPALRASTPSRRGRARSRR